MLKAIVLEIDGDREFIKKNFLGYQIYSFFINQIKKINHEKASFYHQKNRAKPFTLTAPFMVEDRIFIRFCFLNDEIFSIFISSLFDQREISIGEKEFKLKKVYLTPEKNLPKKIAGMIKNYSNNGRLNFLKLKVEILTPIIFKVGNRFEIVPTVSLIKNSFEQKQKQIYNDKIFKLPEFVITKVQIHSKEIIIKPFGNFVGSMGNFEIKLKEKNPDILSLEYFGLGIKTTMGLGQIILKEISS